MKRPFAWFSVMFVTILFLLQIWNGAICVNNPVTILDSGEKSLSGYVQGDQIQICGTVKDYSYNNQYGQISTELILKNIQILPYNKEGSNEKDISINQKYSKENLQNDNALHDDGDKVIERIIDAPIITQKAQSVMVYLDEKTKLNIGSRIILKGELNFWNAATNPGEFDAEQYYGNRDILFAIKKAEILRISTSSNWILQELRDFRMKQEELLIEHLGAGNAAIMKAMLFGNLKEIEADIKGLYRNNGIAHIFAISGLHISLLGMAVYRLLQRLPLPKWLVLSVSEIFLLLYGCMVGFSASTFRAIGMFTFFLLGKLLKRSYDMITAMAFCAIAWLMIHPRYIFDCGFQLSYGAIIGIGILLPVLQAITDSIRYKYFRKGLALFIPSLSVTLITAPILIHHYYELSFFSIALNIIVLPLMAPLLLSGVGMLAVANICDGFCGASNVWNIWMLSAKLLAIPINLILGIYERGCQLLELLPIGRKNIAPLSVCEMILYYSLLFAMTILVKRKKHPYQFIFVLASVFLLLFPRKPDFSVCMLDVGQGDCNVIFTDEGQCFVIDCGSTSKRNVGEKVLIPFLKYHGIGQVDGVIITHPDADHMNGIENLLELGREENIEVSSVYIYEKGIENEFAEWEEILTLAYKQNIPVVGIGQGDVLQTGDFSMECIYPLDEQGGLTGNEASLVMKVECGEFQGLFAGDLEIEGEERLVAEYSSWRMDEYKLGASGYSNAGDVVIDSECSNSKLFGENSCDLLKVGHHGSSGSSSEEFLQWVAPSCSVISCGENNVYGHPHAETLERLEKNGVLYLITYEEGAVCFRGE